MSEFGRYLIVCNDDKTYFDPKHLTGCVGFGGFSVFDNVGRALLLLTHTNNTPSEESHEPSPHISTLVGRWVNKRVFTAGEHHVGKEFTGNKKLGNLYTVAKECFTDISIEVLDMLNRYEKYLKGELPIPVPEVEEPSSDSDMSEPAEVEVVDNIRFITKYDGAKRYTVIQEKVESSGNGGGEPLWRTVHLDEEGDVDD